MESTLWSFAHRAAAGCDRGHIAKQPRAPGAAQRVPAARITFKETNLEEREGRRSGISVADVTLRFRLTRTMRKELRMTGGRLRTLAVAAVVALAWMVTEASGAQCGNAAAGFEAWKRQFAEEARARGVRASTVAALMATSYSTATIAADRGQRSFGLSLDQFLAKRGGSAIVARGRALKQSNAGLFASIQQRFGVPPGPLLAIWGMETDFGRSRGNQNTLSAVTTLAYDCRRTAYFTDQLYAALTLIDRGILSAGTRGSMHGEIGHTQFLPRNILNYGTGGSLDIAANALASTANFLRRHGWRAGAGYQPGEGNFAAIQAWNAAPVYQRAIALIGRQIDGGEGSAARR
jgi:membrane-bound lytic murein transglycosylase B